MPKVASVSALSGGSCTKDPMRRKNRAQKSKGDLAQMVYVTEFGGMWDGGKIG